MIEDLIIETLSEKYIPTVARYYAQLAVYIKESTNDDYFDFTSLSSEEIEDELRLNLNNNDLMTYVAVVGGYPAGFISGSITNCFLPISTLKKVGYISGAFISAAFRNKGIMREMENRIVQFFKDRHIKYVELNVLTKNTSGRNCWNKLGYDTFREQLRKKI